MLILYLRLISVCIYSRVDHPKTLQNFDKFAIFYKLVF